MQASRRCESSSELSMLLDSQLSVPLRTPQRGVCRSATGIRTVGNGLAEVHGGQQSCVREEHRPPPDGTRQHQVITHPPENHLESSRRRVSTCPWNGEAEGGMGGWEK